MLLWLIGYLASAGFWATLLTCVILSYILPDFPLLGYALVGLAF